MALAPTLWPAAHPDEPAVHITFDEAAAYCAWRGQRLPTRDEWINAAYTEQRPSPPAPFVTGTTYRYPTGNTPDGANCLSDCGIEATPPLNKPDYSSLLWRGSGHAWAGSTKQGVNGLYEMGANVWEWAKLGAGNQQATMGGLVVRRRANDGGLRSYPLRGMAVVYIGFRCAGRLGAAMRRRVRPVTGPRHVPLRPAHSDGCATIPASPGAKTAGR